MKKCSVHQPRNPKSDDLHKVIRENYQSVFYEKEAAGVNFPFHLRREFSKYLRFGILAYGFARFNCGHCGKDKLVAYSCKGRSVCPSCTGRRMADTAMHLVENVIPEVPVRQWVFSMPYKHRFLLSANPKLLTTVLGIYNRAIAGSYKTSAKKMGIKDPKVGNLTVIQRFGGALNLNIHFHTLVMDGVYAENEAGKQVFYEVRPSDKDIIQLIETLEKRINRALYKRGYLDNLLDYEYSVEDSLAEDETLLQLKSQSVTGLTDDGRRPTQLGKYRHVPFTEFKGRRCAARNGYSLHANVKILRHQRAALEKLCRYICRGPVAKERIFYQGGMVQLKLKKAYADGTTHLEFTSKQFISRLISLVPPPRQNFIRYFGVFGARHRNRNEITSKAKASAKKEKTKTSYRTLWAELLKRVYKYEVIYCDSCGTKLKLIAAITSFSECRKILDHLGLDTEQVSEAVPRAPPQQEFEPTTDSDFDQSSSW